MSTIEQVLRCVEDKKFFNIKVQGRLEKDTQPFLYTCCPKCGKQAATSVGDTFECIDVNCKQLKVAVQRMKFDLNIYDDTGSINVTFFGKEAKKLLGYIDEEHLLAKMEEDKHVQLIEEKLLDVTFLLRLKVRVFNFSTFYTADAVDISTSGENIVGQITPETTTLTAPTPQSMAKKRLNFDNDTVLDPTDKSLAEGREHTSKGKKRLWKGRDMENYIAEQNLPREQEDVESKFEPPQPVYRKRRYFCVEESDDEESYCAPTVVSHQIQDKGYKKVAAPTVGTNLPQDVATHVENSDTTENHGVTSKFKKRNKFLMALKENTKKNKPSAAVVSKELAFGKKKGITHSAESKNKFIKDFASDDSDELLADIAKRGKRKEAKKDNAKKRTFRNTNKELLKLVYI